jgi:hypothetical protein
MSATYAIANVLHSLQVLKESIAPQTWSNTPLPVISAPGWWLEEVQVELGAPAGTAPCEIHGCAVLRQDALPEPVLVNHDGKVYPIVPKWLQAARSAQ